MTTTASLLPKPMLDSATEPYFAAARDGVLQVKRCRECHRLHWYPRPLCPYCMGATEWLPVSGNGEIYSITISRRGRPEPYALAYVRLDEGVTVLTNVIADKLDALRIGQRVRVIFKPTVDGWKLPVFAPVDSI